MQQGRTKAYLKYIVRGWKRRLFNRRGYIVQSPSAYRLLHEAILNRHSYYAYDLLKERYPAQELKKRQLSRRFLELSYRLCLYLRPQKIRLYTQEAILEGYIAEAKNALAYIEREDLSFWVIDPKEKEAYSDLRLWPQDRAVYCLFLGDMDLLRRWRRETILEDAMTIDMGAICLSIYGHSFLRNRYKLYFKL